MTKKHCDEDEERVWNDGTVSQMFRTEEYFASIVSGHLSESLVVTDTRGRLEWVNQNFERLTGYSVADIIGRKPGEFLQGAETDQKTVAEIRAAVEARQPIKREILNYHADGTPYWVEVAISPVFDAEARHVHFVAVEQDVTARRLVAAKIQEAQDKDALQKKQRQLLTTISQWLYSARTLAELSNITQQGLQSLFPGSEGVLYVYRNSRDRLEARAVWGDHSPESSIPPHQCWGMRRGRPHVYGAQQMNLRCEHDTSPNDAAAICLPLLAQGESIGLLHVRFPDLAINGGVLSGEFRPVLQDRLELLMLVAEQTGLAIANVQLREELHAQSTIDALTGLPNRRHFLGELRDAAAASVLVGEPLTLLSLDVDHFKSVNDRHGHAVGDEVLKLLAQVLREVAGPQTLLARFGGEEFMLIPRGLSPDAAADLANAIIDSVRERSAATSSVPNITVSVGLAVMPRDAPDLTGLLKCADDALYRAKAAGRNRLVKFAEMDTAPLLPLAVVAKDGA